MDKDLKRNIRDSIENTLADKYSPEDFEYESDLREAINELNYLKDEYNDVLMDEIANNIDIDCDICIDDLSDDDYDEFMEIVCDEADYAISNLEKNAVVEDDLSYYNPDDE